MTSTSNARELDKLRQARTEAQGRFARQMRLLEQIEGTAGELGAVTQRWNGQLAALADLAGSAQAAAELSGLPKSDLETAVKSVDRAAVDAAVQAATPAQRRRRQPSPAAPGDSPSGSDGSKPAGKP